jgi:hypothetical protein
MKFRHKKENFLLLSVAKYVKDLLVGQYYYLVVFRFLDATSA